MRNLFPGISNRIAPQIPKNPDQSFGDAVKTYIDTQKISPRSGTDPAPTPAADNLEKYGMCNMDLERYMVVCGMKPVQ